MHHTRGIVRRASDGAPVDGVRLEFRAAGGKRFADGSSAITGTAGAFDLVVREGRRTLPKTLRVLDRDGSTLAELPYDKDAHDLDVVIDDATLATAALRDRDDRTVLRAAALALIQAKGDELKHSQRDDGPALSKAVAGVVAELPPLATHPTLVALAAEVLRGSAASYDAFARELELLDDWNTRVFGPNVVVSREMATELLEATEVVEPHAAASPAAEAPLDARALYTVVGAAMRVAGGDPARALANVGVVARQLCPIRNAIGLHAAARRADSLGRLDAFADRASVVAEDWGPDPGPDDRPRRPFPPSGPRPPLPGCPDGNPWPPLPIGVKPTLPPLPVPGAAEQCPDWIRSFGVFARERTYTIDAIVPQDACVGDRVTVTGSNLIFEQSNTTVTFAGLATGSRVEARIIGTPTATEITVEVPLGATCGPVELHSDDSSVEICGEFYELFHGPRVPAHFAGGMPQISSLRVNGVAPDATGVLARCVSADRPLLVSWNPCGVVTDVHVEASYGGAVVWTLDPRPPVDEVRFPVPADPSEAVYTITVTLTGRCGTAEASATVPVRHALLGSEPLVDYEDNYDFENFHRNWRRDDIESYMPPNLDTLRAAVIVAETEGEQVGVTGSRCSYTNCVVPDGTDRLIRMDRLQRWLNLNPSDFNGGAPAWRGHSPDRVPLVSELLPDGPPMDLGPVLRDRIASVLSDAAAAELHRVSEMTGVADRLVYVEAGMLVEELNAMLDHHDPPLALATMGAGTHQTLAGAISTGTHGSTWRLPPLADFVRAIHLIGSNGEQWWLEPASRPVTDPVLMRNAAFAGQLGLKPCARIRYDDGLFNAALVSAGCAGLIYAFVIEAVPGHRMKTAVSELSWDDAKRHLLAEFANAAPTTWYLEAIVRPSREAVLNQKWLTTEPLTPVETPEDPTALEEAARIAALIAAIAAALAAASAAVAVEVAEAVAELAALTAAFAFIWDTDAYEAAAARVAILGDFLEGLADGVAILAAGGDDQSVADALPNLVELLWQISPLGIDAGLAAIDEIQLLQTLDFKRVPEVAKSFTALTNQPEGAPADVPRHERYKPTERIMRSSEYAFSLNAGLAFVDELLDETDRLREGDDAFILSINVRFTAPTHALIGMQQYSPISVHVELFTMRGLDGNDEIDAAVDRLVRRHRGAPHWGQLHPLDLDWNALYGPKLNRWRSAIDALADGRDTFRHRFATERGLIV